MRTTAGIDVNVDGLMRIQIDAAINPGLLTGSGMLTRKKPWRIPEKNGNEM